MDGVELSATRPSASSAWAASASWWPSGRWPSACGSSPTTRSCPPDRARQMSVELVDLDELLAGSDFLTLHVAKTPETVGLIDAELLAKAKPGIRIINVARGGIIDEQALADAITVGHVGGAAIDVFADEPTTESPLFGLAGVVVTPHLGASTARGPGQGRRHHRRAGGPGPGRRLRALRRERRARPRRPRPCGPSCRWPSGSASCSPLAWPTRPRRARRRVPGPDRRLRHPHPHPVGAEGLLRPHHRRAGVLRERAPAGGREQGLQVRRRRPPPPRTTSTSSPSAAASHALAGTLVGLRGEPRIVMVDDHTVDVPPARPHAGGAQRRPPRGDRRRGHAARRGRRQHRRHGRRPVRRRRGRRSWCWPCRTEVPETVQDQLRADARIKGCAAWAAAPTPPATQRREARQPSASAASAEA